MEDSELSKAKKKANLEDECCLETPHQDSYENELMQSLHQHLQLIESKHENLVSIIKNTALKQAYHLEDLTTKVEHLIENQTKMERHLLMQESAFIRQERLRIHQLEQQEQHERRQYQVAWEQELAHNKYLLQS